MSLNEICSSITNPVGPVGVSDADTRRILFLFFVMKVSMNIFVIIQQNSIDICLLSVLSNSMRCYTFSHSNERTCYLQGLKVLV